MLFTTSLSIKEVMNNFLTHPVRIQVQNNQNRSQDSPPCYHSVPNCLYPKPFPVSYFGPRVMQ